MSNEIVRIECLTCGKAIPIPTKVSQLDAKLQRHATACKPGRRPATRQA